MKKQKSRNCLSLEKRKIAKLNYVHAILGGSEQGQGEYPTGGETTKPNIPIPDTYVLACINDSKQYILKKKVLVPVIVQG